MDHRFGMRARASGGVTLGPRSLRTFTAGPKGTKIAEITGVRDPPHMFRIGQRRDQIAKADVEGSNPVTYRRPEGIRVADVRGVMHTRK